jgi:hypothetical protein
MQLKTRRIKISAELIDLYDLNCVISTRCGHWTLVIRQALYRLWKQNRITLQRNSRVTATDFWLQSQSMVHCCPQKSGSTQVSINCVHLLAWGCCHCGHIKRGNCQYCCHFSEHLLCTEMFVYTSWTSVLERVWNEWEISASCRGGWGGSRGSSLTVHFLVMNCLTEWWAGVLGMMEESAVDAKLKPFFSSQLHITLSVFLHN